MDLNVVSADFLVTDIDVAMTFLDVAQTSQVQETVTRNYRNARVAYDTVVHFLDILRLTDDDRRRVEDKLKVLEARMRRLGQPV